MANASNLSNVLVTTLVLSTLFGRPAALPENVAKTDLFCLNPTPAPSASETPTADGTAVPSASPTADGTAVPSAPPTADGTPMPSVPPEQTSSPSPAAVLGSTRKEYGAGVARQLPPEEVSVDCSGMDLSKGGIECPEKSDCGQGWDFSNSTMDGLEIENCCIQLSSFDFTTAIGAEIGRAGLDPDQVRFDDSTFLNADWSDSKIYANFSGTIKRLDAEDNPAARMSVVKMINVDFTGSHILRLVQFNAVNFTGSKMNHGMNIHGNITSVVNGPDAPPRMPMDDCIFRDTDLSNAEFKYIDGRGNRFNAADLTNTTWEFVDLVNTEWREATLSSAAFGDSNLSDVRLISADLTGVHLRNLKITRGNASGSDWSDATTFNCPESFQSGCPAVLATEVDFSGSKFVNSLVFKSIFDSCDFTGADMTNVNARLTNFAGSKFMGVDFTRARLYGADFRNTTGARNAIFKDAEVGNIKGLYTNCTTFCEDKSCSCFEPSPEPNPSDDPNTPECVANCNTNAECFPSTALVLLADGSEKAMHELALGDVVVTGKGTSPVFFFSHRATNQYSTFVTFQFEDGKSLSVTPGHYVYRSNGALAPASSIQVGDALSAQGADRVVARRSASRLRGLYAPHTVDGDLIVDGTHVSSYTTAVSPVVAHGLLSPLRALYRVGFTLSGLLDESPAEWILSLLPSSSLTN